MYYFQRPRELIYEHDLSVEKCINEVEVDERYFGGGRKGQRGRGASEKVPVLGLLMRDGKVVAMMKPDAKTDTLLPNTR